MGINKINLIGAVLITLWFFYNAYLLINNTKRYGDEYYQAYSKLYSYYQKNIYKEAKHISPIPLPNLLNPEIFLNYKTKVP